MRVLVTGANGHLGFNVCKAFLEAGHDVRASIRSVDDRAKADPLRAIGVTDIVGLNVYHYSHFQLGENKKREVLGPRDQRRKPLSEMLEFAWQRYRRPIIIGETSGYQEHRAEWLRMTIEESLKALNSGVELHGICLYPFVDLPDWWSQEWAKIATFLDRIFRKPLINRKEQP